MTLNEEKSEVHPRRKGHDVVRHVGGVWRAERRCLATPGHRWRLACEASLPVAIDASWRHEGFLS